MDLVKLAPWALRAAWLALPLTVGPAVAQALDGRDGPVGVVAAALCWAGWTAGLVAALVPSTASLTALRILAPGAVAVAVWAAVAGADASAAAVALGGALLAGGLGLTAEVATPMVQGSAYGDEARFPLRTPAAILLGVAPLAVAVVLAGLTAGPLLLAAGRVPAGALALAAGLPLAWLLARRLHQLSRRWVVLVPAGLVLHDPVVLADTAMFRRTAIAGLAVALEGTEAADCTGRTLGGALELRLRDLGTVVLASTPRQPGGRALHVRSLLFAPARPGAVLAEAGRRRLPVTVG